MQCALLFGKYTSDERVRMQKGLFFSPLYFFFCGLFSSNTSVMLAKTTLGKEIHRK